MFHHDGQVLDEDFEYASFRMSRMGHAGPPNACNATCSQEAGQGVGVIPPGGQLFYTLLRGWSWKDEQVGW